MKTETTGSPAHAPQWLVVTAFAAVYVFWGATYLGIRFAVETIPPFLMAGTRNLAAGLLLFAIARVRSSTGPTLREWRDAAIIGGLLLTVGNGGVTWAEQTVPSGVAALLVAVTPAWIVIMDWVRPKGTRPGWLLLTGLAVGFAGVALLAREHQTGSEAGSIWGVIVLMIASLAWSFGSIFSRSARKPASSLLGIGMQMTAGGVLLLVLAIARGESADFSFGQVTVASIGAWLYLVVAGSLIGYTAYAWLLQVSTPARVSTYGYVNPFIAVLLGCTIGHEPLSHELVVAGALIIVAVIMIVTGGSTKVNTTPCEEVA